MVAARAPQAAKCCCSPFPGPVRLAPASCCVMSNRAPASMPLRATHHPCAPSFLWRTTMPLASTSASPGALPGFDDALAWSAEWPSRLAEYVLQSQQLQLQAWLSWQEGLAAIQHELWDLWACR